MDRATMDRLAEAMVREVPEGWMYCCPAEHPRDGRVGVIMRNWRTGTFAMYDGETVRSIPQDWARATAEQGGALAWEGW